MPPSYRRAQFAFLALRAAPFRMALRMCTHRSKSIKPPNTNFSLSTTPFSEALRVINTFNCRFELKQIDIFKVRILSQNSLLSYPQTNRSRFK